jgi:hypothetical protein
MLMAELFSRGIMTMGPSRVDPSRQIGVFNPEYVSGLPALRTAEMEKFRWIVGEWNHENAVPATRSNPAYVDIGSSRYSLGEGGNWVCIVTPNGREIPLITFDPFSRQWIFTLTNGAYCTLRSSEGWIQTDAGDQIVFTGFMTMIGINADWRMTWTRKGSDEFGFTNEERSEPGSSWDYIDEWTFRRKPQEAD